MAHEHRIIEGPYLADLLYQPQALSDTVSGLQLLPDLGPETFDRIVLTGMGGSLHSLHPLNLELIEHGFTPLMVETSELIYYQRGLLDPRTLLVVVSQSGSSAETLRLLDEAGPGAKIVGVTNTADSPLAKRATPAVVTCAGAEATVSSKTVVAALVALRWLAASLCKQDLARTRAELEQAAPAAARYLARWRDHAASLAVQLDGVRDVFFTGRGSSLAAVGVGGLILKESAHIHSEGLSGAGYRHGPFEMVGPEVFVLVFEGDPATAPLNRRLVDDVRRAGGRAALCGPGADFDAFRLPEVPPSIRPVLEMLPVEMISLAFAALSGREAGRFERITKVTTGE